MATTWRVVVHGGAWAIPDEAVQDHKNGVRAAARHAAELLRSGAAALDAVQAAVVMLEDDPTFDAGRGSFANSAGDVEMDAILATDDFRIGACCAVRNLRNPVKLARVVMDNTKNVVVVGDGCRLLAEEYKLETCETVDLLVGRELERYHETKARQNFDAKTSFQPAATSVRVKPNGMGTVGVVCVDIDGRMAVGLSTGGTPFKRPGRVGDTPLWGSGAYVERDIAGAAATGYGEDLIRVLFTRTAVDAVRAGASATAAAEEAVRQLGSKVNGAGGVILLTGAPSYNGIGLAFNTPRMAFAFLTGDDANGEPICGIEPGDVQQLISRQHST